MARSILEDAILYGHFNTQDANQDPVTLAGTPSLKVYKDESDTEITAGITLSVNQDGDVGSHRYKIDTSADANYTPGSQYAIKIAAGTVDGHSVVGKTVGMFIITRDIIIPLIDYPEEVDAVSQSVLIRVNIINSEGSAVDLDALPGGLSLTITQADGSPASSSVAPAIKDTGVGRYYFDMTTTTVPESLIGEFVIARAGSATITVPFGMNIVTSSSKLVDDVWDEVLTGGTHNVPNSAGRRLRTVPQVTSHSGTAQAGGASTITLDTGANSTDNDFYTPGMIFIESGTGQGQFRRITDYVASTRVATVATPWVVVPDNTSEFVIVPWASVRVSDIDPGLDIATQTLLTTVAGYVDTEVAAIKSATDQIATDTGTTIPATLSTISGYVDTEVAAIKAVTDQFVFSTPNQVDARVLQINTGLVPTAQEVAAATEAAILNEGDATALLAAIAAKVEEFLINEGDASATLAAMATAVRQEIFGNASFDGLTFEQAQRVMLAVLAGKASGFSANSPVFRDLADTVNRVEATVTADGRTTVTINP